MAGTNVTSLSSRRRALSKTWPAQVYRFVFHNDICKHFWEYNDLQISVSTNIASTVGFKERSPVILSTVDEPVQRASHVEITFRDEYLTRADMWGLVVSALVNKAIYKDQRVSFMTIKAVVKDIFVQGQKVTSAFYDASTKPIFRSESARYILFIQMSKEMWDFDADGTGEIMFGKVINGFLPELFKRWEQLGVKHLVTIVLFTRLEYEKGLTTGFFNTELDTSDPSMSFIDETSYRDFYRVVVSDVVSASWANILSQLKTEFKVFLRDVSIRQPKIGQYLSLGTGLAAASTDVPKHIIVGRPSTAIRGNLLEAINLASSQFSCDHIDRDLVRTGVSIAVVTPGTGLFEVDYKLLVKTTENIIEKGIGIDIVCLSRMPLHSVPLFKYWHRKSTPEEAREGITDDREHLRGEMSSSQKSDGHINFNRLSRMTAFELDLQLPSVNDLESLKGRHWQYGIPHWIDVSFWSSSSEENRTQAAILGKRVKKTGCIRSQREAFLPRVRMYEIQMMGVMEDAMNDISIPYLNRQNKLSSNSNKVQRESRRVERGDRNFGARGLEFEDDKPTFVLSPTALSVNRISGQFLHNAQWMDEYDEMIFRHPGERLLIENERQAWKHPASSRSSRKRPAGDHSPQIFGSSPSTQNSITDGGPNFEGNTLLVPTAKSKLSSPSTSHKTGSIASIISGTSSLKRPVKLSHQINLGPRGFSTGALKSTPSTEISAKHANSASQLTPGLRPPSSGKVKHNIPEKAGTARSQRLSKSTPLGSRFDRGHCEKDGSYHHVPRPIAIRKLTALRVAQDGIAFLPEEKDPASEITTPQGEATSPWRYSSTSDALDFTRNVSPGSSMAPWLTVLNPSNPYKMHTKLASRLGRWRHVFPRPLRTSKIKWKSLCSPAAVPLTTEEFPSPNQLAEEYEESKYRVAAREDSDPLENLRAQDWLLREMIASRFTHGFQVVIGSGLAISPGFSAVHAVHAAKIFETKCSSERGTTIIMSRGSIIHQLSCTDDGIGIDVRSLARRTRYLVSSNTSGDNTTLYKPAIRTMFSDEYTPQEVDIFLERKEADWETIDTYIAGREKLQAEQFADIHSCRARFVLIPMDPPSSGRRPLRPINEDNEEELRLEGIRKLTQAWQKHRYIPSTERRFQGSASRRMDTNPLDIMYRTLNPSAVIAAEIDNIGSENYFSGRPIQLLPESDLFQRSKLNLTSLAQVIQSEKGVRISNRRWHWRLHYNCFTGQGMTDWILSNFRDVESREEAITVGEKLMEQGLFQHVEHRHQFRDGNYFYHIASKYRAPRPEVSRNWFGSRKTDQSVPSTPMPDGNSEDSPRLPRSRASSTGGEHSEAGGSTPTDHKKRLSVTLSNSLLYNVDYRKRSHRLEVINLHYDRLHNPDNCYHIRIEWMNVTAKLIEDIIISWATTADRFGLRLVELPIDEASAITKMHPFRSPYLVQLAQYPPKKQPHNYLDATSFVAVERIEKNFYQKAIMKRFNFVLDFEAAKDFPPNVDVTYSWGKPDYRYPQFIHRSGVLLAQITDTGDFLLLPNRLYNSRSATNQEPPRNEVPDTHGSSIRSNTSRINRRASPRASPYTSPSFRAVQDVPVLTPDSARYSRTAGVATPEQLSSEFESFCQNAEVLDQFYAEVLSKSSSTGPGTPYMGGSIPTLGLPPSLNLEEEGLPSNLGGAVSKSENNISTKTSIDSDETGLSN